MKNKLLCLLVFSVFVLQSCIVTKDVQYMQPNENLIIDEEGLVPYNVPTYRVTKNDIFNLNIVTTSKGDAAQFYSTLNASVQGTQNILSGQQGVSVIGNGIGGNAQFYFQGIKVDAKGDIYVFGIGYIKAEGRTVKEISDEIQESVNLNFQEGKSEVRLNLDGIRYHILGDIETVGITGEKVSHTQTLNLFEAFAQNGGLNRTVDRKNIKIQRKFPEGMRTVTVDVTREDIQNSPYFWVQNGDVIILNTRKNSFNGFGKDPVQTITTGVTVLTTLLSAYLIFTRL
ncbi:polysaccharide biosynthesis/export family protein [Bergeyella zoohelcum]|uniref:polysaccharide biosynthesis/export family protein n=1 Tax=Bergeyella zoohelcum TaxID=1015 RepID=UPI002A9119F8|nr:polysaccharide biosynthesis/export family protein [Bergeyella zoohelcum]MDY6025049.1 polysaccharide biosynthesis/export family protein [Bergeyella zoohelcum]